MDGSPSRDTMCGAADGSLPASHYIDLRTLPGYTQFPLNCVAGTAVRGTQGWGCGHGGVVRVASDMPNHFSGTELHPWESFGRFKTCPGLRRS